jgi:hypothetical protein
MDIVKNCDQRKHFLLNRVANAWNKLPGEVAHDPNVTSFKAKIDDQINETNTKRTSKIQVLVSYLNYFPYYLDSISKKKMSRSDLRVVLGGYRGATLWVYKIP